MRFFGKKKPASEPEDGEANAGELGEDILDLTPVGGSWEAFVPQFHANAEHAQMAIEYIRTGSMRGIPAANNNNVYRRAAAAAVAPIQEGQHVRRIAALLAALPAGSHRDHAAQLYIKSSYGWPNDGRSALQTLLNTRLRGRLPLADIERLGTVFGWSPDLLAEVLLLPYAPLQFERIKGIDEFIFDRAGQLRVALTPAHKDHIYVWPRLHGATPQLHELFSSQICDAITANNKQLRKALTDIYREMPTPLQVQGLTEVLATAKPAQRGRIVEAADALAVGPDRDRFIAFLQEDLAKDRSAAVKEALEALDREPQADEVSLPPIPTLAEIPEISASAFPNLKNAHHQRSLEGLNSPKETRSYPWAIHELLQSKAPMLAQLTRHHLVRSVRALSGGYTRDIGRLILNEIRNTSWAFTPLDVSMTEIHDGNPGRRIVHTCSAVVGCDPGFWTTTEVTEWAPHHIEDLLEVLEDKADYRLDRDGYLALLSMISPQPARLRDGLVKAAVSGYKTERAVLQQMVELDTIDPVLGYLTSRKRGERIGAADLLRARPIEGAIDALLRAARKEKDDGVMVALLSALDATGASIEEFTSKDAVLEQASKAVAKRNAVPKSIDWLDLATLPTVSWSDGDAVDPVIMQWLVATEVKSKNAEPSPLMVRHFERMNQQELRVFGSTLLDLWMARDTATHSPAEARALAQASVAQHHARVHTSSWHPWSGLTADEAVEYETKKLMNTLIGSESASKGLLGVAAAACDASVADRCGAYIRKHRGRRATQSKTLIQMLAWIDEPATVQLVMSIAARFRPKGIQAEATKQAELLAERRGWTIDDLADRSVPDGGFESNGRKVFDYGARTFTANLADDLSVSLTNDETGKTVRSLPKGRADEDPEVIAELKKDFTAAKKDLKSVAKLQPTRLHLAMCGQRSWSADDFTRYFVQHPVMARLASRLVWASTDGDNDPVGFRPLTDGTLLTANDDEFTPPATAVISIAHGQLLVGEDERWIQHLGDYEVTSLFAQFNRPTVEIGDDQTLIDDFAGFMYNDGTFRGQVNKHGWQLGAPQDAGWVHDIVKDLPMLGIIAVIDLAGGLPVDSYNIGENTLAMGELYFAPAGPYQNKQSALTLGKVPRILLSEVYAEAQAMAQASDGHDPDYKKKVGI